MKRKSVKFWLKALGAVVLLVVIVLAAHPLWISPVASLVVGKVGPRFTGTPVSLGECGVNLYGGNFGIGEFCLSNPTGCSERVAVSVGSFKLDVDELSALSDTIVVHSIEISDVFVSYLQTPSGKFNLNEIADNATGSSASADAPAEKPAEEAAPAKDESPAKKIIIERLSVSNVRAMMFGMKIPLVPGTIELKDIGKSTNGVALQDAWKEVLDRVMKSAGVAGGKLSSLGDLGAEWGRKGLNTGSEGLKSALDSVKKMDVEGAREILKGTGDDLKSLGKEFKGLFK